MKTRKEVYFYLFFILAGLLVFIPYALADSVTLRSGRKIEGKIIERTPEYIKIDFYGTTLTYYNDEIKDITGGPASSESDSGYDSFCLKAAVFLRQGFYQEAIKQLKQAVKINPYSAAAYNDLGVAYACGGKYIEAIGQFKEALQRESGDYSEIIKWNLANVYCLAGELDEVNNIKIELRNFNLIPILATAIKLKEKKANVVYAIAASSFPPDTADLAPLPSSMKKEALDQIRYQQDQEMQLTQDKTYVIENFPLLFLYHSPLSYLNLAQSYIAAGDLLKAGKYLEEGQKNINNTQEYFNRIALAGIYFFRGKIALDSNNYSDAQQNFYKAAELFPKWYILNTFLGISYYVDGRYDKAKDAFKVALKYIKSDSKQAQEIENYLKEIKHRQKAD